MYFKKYYQYKTTFFILYVFVKNIINGIVV